METIAKVLFAGIIVAVLGVARANAQNNQCLDVAKDFVNKTITARQAADILNNQDCFLPIAISDLSLNFRPQRASFWAALQSFGNGQQQGSNLSSTASSNAVTKGGGPSAIAEEFGGINVNSGTSALTLQYSPGSLLTNLAVYSVRPVCDTVLKTNCTNLMLLKALDRLTFKATANTTTNSQTVTGTGTSTTSSSSAQPATLTAKGPTTPTFGGMTVQFAIIPPKIPALAKGSGQQTSGTASARVTQYVTELTKADKLIIYLNTADCKNVYSDWLARTVGELTGELAKGTQQSVDAILESEYHAIARQLLAPAKGTCSTVRAAMEDLFASELAAEAYEDFSQTTATSTAPELSAEYDLSTPQNQPNFSSVKLSGTLQFGKSPTVKKSNQPTQKTKDVLTTLANARKSALTAANATKSPVPSTSPGQPDSSDKAAAAKLTPPLSFNLMLVADIYNSAPPASVPSSTRLRDVQAGGEIDYRLPSLPLVGAPTLAGAYYYQDQTSPSLVNGPSSNSGITFTGLPSTASTVYTTRGPINLGQIRLGFGTGNNLSFPIAATYSNRTELIVHPTWGLQFGLSYNLDALFSSASSSSTASPK